VLRGERPIELRRPPETVPRRSKRKAAKGAIEDPLFETLRAWRASIAKEHGVPAYVVFHDGTLHAIAQLRPMKLDQLRQISGVGEKKLASYGDSLLELVRAARS
jgi:ATP-dependent DNA helicase RecQ